jgi:hypothetical protein
MSDELAELFNLEVDEFNKKPKVFTPFPQLYLYLNHCGVTISL